MSTDVRAAELLVEWEEARQQGQPISLEDLCKDAPELLSEVERRIAVLGAMQSVLGTQAQKETLTTSPDGEPVRGWIDLPGYECLGVLGSGGMGVVFKARQLNLQRIVAVKVVRSQGMTGPQLARLQSEAEAVARLNHSHIVGVHEIGEHDGCPFLVLELVGGGTLSAKIADAALRPIEAADLMETVARAVHFAHEADVIHRDLKPANVLLTEDGVPKIADFGLAKRLDDDSDLTRTGDVMGTPSYMAPEQALGKTDQIDRRTDVYALGATLYESLTGRPPFKGTTPLDTLRRIVSEEVLPPSRLQPGLPRDLETVCLKCLQKDPRKRFATAAELADDLERFQKGEPVRARSIGRVARSWRWIRRNPMRSALTATAAVALALLGGLFVGARYQSELEDSLQREQQLTGKLSTANERIEQAHYLRQVALALSLWKSGDVQRARTVLKSLPEKRRHWEWRYVDRLCHAELITFRGHHGESESRLGRRLDITAMAFSPDGKWIASADNRRIIHVWDVASGRVKLTLKGHTQAVSGLAFRPDGKRIVSSSFDETLRVWNADTGKSIHILKGHKWGVVSVDWSPDGKRIASGGGDNLVRIWHNSGRLERTLTGHTTRVQHVVFSRDAKQIATAGFGTVRVWSLRTGKQLSVRKSAQRDVACVAFRRKGDFDVELVEKSSVSRWHGGFVDGVAISRDGSLIASGGAGGEIKVSRGDHNDVTILKGHVSRVECLAFSPDGRHLASGGLDGTVKVWSAVEDREHVTLKNFDADLLSFHPNGSLMICAGGSRGRVSARLLGDLRKSLWSKELPDIINIKAVAVSPGGKQIALGSDDDTVRLLSVETGKTLKTWNAHSQGVNCVAYHPTGSRLVTGGRDGAVRVWRALTGDQALLLEGHVGRVTGVAFSPDGNRILSGGRDGRVKIWDAQTGRASHTLKGHKGPVNSVAFSPDGRRVLSGGRDNTVRLWDSKSGRQLFELAGHTARVTSVAFSPDGKRIVTGSNDGTVRVWDSQIGIEAIVLSHERGGIITGVTFSPDGNRIAAIGFDVQIWETN